MVSKALAVAALAALALVASIGVDAAMNRTFAIDVREGQGWRAVGQHPHPGFYEDRPDPVGGGVVAGPNDTIQLRLRIDNGYPWAFEERYRVVVDGLEVAQGTLSAPARSQGEATFELPAKPYYDAMTDPRAKTVPGSVHAYVEVVVGDERFGAGFQLREAA